MTIAYAVVIVLVNVVLAGLATVGTVIISGIFSPAINLALAFIGVCLVPFIASRSSVGMLAAHGVSITVLPYVGYLITRQIAIAWYPH